MPPQTEAACLLESGALYTKRIMLSRDDRDPIFAGIKRGAFSLYYGDAPIFHFDLEGRWQRLFLDGVHYLKGLDAAVQAIDRVREGANLVLKRRTLGFAEAADLDATVRSAALDLLRMLGSDDPRRIAPPSKAEPLTDDELRSLLEAIAGWDAARWFAQRERYLATYGPMPILPPDCQHAVVLQATLGPAGGTTFGRKETAEPYVRTPTEFEEHARAVAALFGRRLLQCKNLFLAGGDVLRRPKPDVRAYLETIARTFAPGPDAEESGSPSPLQGAPRLEGVHAFLDDPRAPRPDVETWRAYAGRGLGRVSLGVESGDAGVRALYGKGWTDEDLSATVSDLKEAGIGVGVMLLAGAGGREHAATHVERSLALLDALPLGPGDLVSLLDAGEVARAGDVGERADVGFTPLTPGETAEQQATLRTRLAAFRTRTGAKVVPYSLEKQALG